MLKYKVVEINSVTEDTIETALNEMTREGWRFDGLHFAMRESSKRPSMAFVIFTREEGKHERATTPWLPPESGDREPTTPPFGHPS